MHDDPSALDHRLEAFGRQIRGAADRRTPRPGEIRTRARATRARRRAVGGGSVALAATVLGSAAVWHRLTPAPVPQGSLAVTGAGTAPASTGPSPSTSVPSPTAPSSVTVPTAPTAPATIPGPGAPPTTATRPAVTAPAPPTSPPPAGERFSWPADGRLGDRFGVNPTSGRRHEGLDILAPVGTPVRAAQDGRVVTAGHDATLNGGYGNLVIIEHAGGFTTRYAHLSAVGVAVGDVVSDGQVIGATGMTGNVASAQVHFEIRRGDVAEDPLAHLP
jgi:murein DD-endopeptidase MepM/ murein hydrolase activator NlpD